MNDDLNEVIRAEDAQTAEKDGAAQQPLEDTSALKQDLTQDL